MCVCAVLLCLFLNLVIWESFLDDNFVLFDFLSGRKYVTQLSFHFSRQRKSNFYHDFFVPICDRFDVVIQLFDLSVLNPHFYSHSFIRFKRLFLPTVAEIFLIYLAVTLLQARAFVILKKINSFFLFSPRMRRRSIKFSILRVMWRWTATLCFGRPSGSMRTFRKQYRLGGWTGWLVGHIITTAADRRGFMEGKVDLLIF